MRTSTAALVACLIAFAACSDGGESGNERADTQGGNASVGETVNGASTTTGTSKGGGNADGFTESAMGGGGAGGNRAVDGRGGTNATAGGNATGGASNELVPNTRCQLVWESGFENGFPGEFASYDAGYWSADGSQPQGFNAGWTIVGRASGEPVYEGERAYKGWISAAWTDNHRPYPGIHEHRYRTPLVNTFMVYLDVDYEQLGDDWIHFGTWGNAEGQSGTWALHTMSVRDRFVEFAHTEPFLGEWIGPQPKPEFPLRRWVRFTVYLHYEGASGYVQAWQDGIPILRANVAQLAGSPGTELITAHWGLYAPPGVESAVQYNDAIRLWALDTPLADFQTEPICGE